jgi:hypothetical protein
MIQRLGYGPMGCPSGRLYLPYNGQHIRREGVRCFLVGRHAFCLRIGEICSVSENRTLCLLLSQSGASPISD